MQEVYEQLDIFSFLEQSEKDMYCWDTDINHIHSELVNLAEKFEIPITNDEFTVWEHVPQYGFRMDLQMKVTKDVVNNPEFTEKISQIVEDAKNHKVELDPMWGALYFFTGQDTSSLIFYSTFLDKERMKKR